MSAVDAIPPPRRMDSPFPSDAAVRLALRTYRKALRKLPVKMRRRADIAMVVAIREAVDFDKDDPHPTFNAVNAMLEIVRRASKDRK